MISLFYSWCNVNWLFLKRELWIDQFWWLVKEAYLRWWIVIEDSLVTRDSGWWKSAKFLVIGELTNLILVIDGLRRVYTPLPK